MHVLEKMKPAGPELYLHHFGDDAFITQLQGGAS